MRDLKNKINMITKIKVIKIIIVIKITIKEIKINETNHTNKGINKKIIDLIKKNHNQSSKTKSLKMLKN